MKKDTRGIQGLGIPIVAQVRNHIIFLAKTMKYYPISRTAGPGRNPKMPVTPPFAG